MGLPAVASALYTALTNDSAVAALVGVRVYALQAPAESPLPFITFSRTVGMMTNDSPRQTTDDTYRIESVSSSRAGAETLDNAVYDTLHLNGITASGWSNFWIVRGRSQEFIDNYNGIQVFRFISDYVIQFDKD